MNATIKNILISFIEGLLLAGLPSMGTYAITHIGTVLTAFGIGGTAGLLKVLYNYYVTKTIPTPSEPTSITNTLS